MVSFVGWRSGISEECVMAGSSGFFLWLTVLTVRASPGD